MKHTLIEKISLFIEKHFKRIIVGFCMLILIVPILIWLCYSLIPSYIPTEFSADGLLSFFGGILGVGASILVALVALYQSKKANDATEELEIEKRRNQIKPYLQVELIKLSDNLFEITITNHSPNAALGVYLFEYPLFPAVTNRKNEKRKIVFSPNDNKNLYISDSWFEKCDDDVPKEIQLYFLDIDNNVLSQKFQRDEGNSYKPCEIDYN